MTDVHFSWKQLDGIVNSYMAASGVVTITPISYNREDKSLVTDASSAKRVSGEYDFNLPPNSNGTFYQFELNPNGGSTVIEYRFVPDNPSIDYVDLPLVDKNADFVTDPSVPPWIAELEALKESGDFFVTQVERYLAPIFAVASLLSVLTVVVVLKWLASCLPAWKGPAWRPSWSDALAIGVVGWALWSVGRFEEAAALFEQAYDSYKDSAGFRYDYVDVMRQVLANSFQEYQPLQLRTRPPCRRWSKSALHHPRRKCRSRSMKRIS